MPPMDHRFPVLIGDDNYDWKAATLLIREVCMLKFVEEITNKAQWWEKVFNPQVAEKWKQEALEMNWKEYRNYADFTPTMAEAVSFDHPRCQENTQMTGTILVH